MFLEPLAVRPTGWSWVFRYPHWKAAVDGRLLTGNITLSLARIVKTFYWKNTAWFRFFYIIRHVPIAHSLWTPGTIAPQNKPCRTQKGLSVRLPCHMLEPIPRSHLAWQWMRPVLLQTFAPLFALECSIESATKRHRCQASSVTLSPE